MKKNYQNIVALFFIVFAFFEISAHNSAWPEIGTSCNELVSDSNGEIEDAMNSISSFTLVNADTNEDIVALSEGMEINLNAYPNTKFNIRANASSDTKSVRLQLSGALSKTQTESVAPYALYGDVNGNYAGTLFLAGDYTITATSYSATGAGGVAGDPFSINFKVVETAAQQPFITTWMTERSNNKITIPTHPDETYNYTVNWGDGSSDTGVTSDITHDYESAGTYQISITGVFPRIVVSDGEYGKFKAVDQWGDIKWSSMESAFANTGAIEIRAMDVPNLSAVTSMRSMFNQSSPTINAMINSWNVSTVVDMSYLFADTDIAFNQAVGNWDVGNVRDMSFMFYHAEGFNQAIGDWDVSNVTNMDGMFWAALSFNQVIGDWDVSQVTNMSRMFRSTSFNQDIGDWDVSKVTSMRRMFTSSPFNQPLGDWDVSNVTNMEEMFSGVFDQDISGWNFTTAREMDYFVSGLSVVNYDALLMAFANNDVARTRINAPSMRYCEGEIARQKLIDDLGWQITDGGKSDDCNTANTISSFTLVNADTNEDIVALTEGMEINLNAYPNTKMNIRANASADTKSVRLQLSGALSKTQTESLAPYALYGDVNGNYAGTLFPAGDYAVTATSYSAAGAGGSAGDPFSISFKVVENVQQPFITTWMTERSNNKITIPTHPDETYNYTVNWGDGTSDTGVTSDITHDYESAGTYQISITGVFPRIVVSDGEYGKFKAVDQWGDIKWSSMESAFANTAAIEIRAMDVPNLSAVTSMRSMFNQSSPTINAMINSWNVSTVVDMSYLFADTDIAFNQAVGNWDVGNVRDMSFMFYHAEGFNQAIGDWDVSNVTNMDGMFWAALSFNQVIGDWDVSQVTNMSRMFRSTSFNQDIGDWDVSKVTSMRRMFTSSPFNQPLGDWDVSSVTNMEEMFSGVFDQDISGWNFTTAREMDYFVSGLSVANYDALLMAFANNDVARTYINAPSMRYCEGEIARQKLIDELDWEITDGGKSDDCSSGTATSANLLEATFLQGSSNPYPTGPILRAEEGRRVVYMKYDLSAFTGTVTEAELKMQVASDPGHGTLEVFMGSHSNWTESGLNGSNKPVAVGNALASISGTHSLGQTKTWRLNASQIPTGGVITLIVKHSAGNDVAFASDESSNPPVLTVTAPVAAVTSAKQANATVRSLRLSPNPASSETTIALKTPKGTALTNDIYVYDILGRVLKTIPASSIGSDGVYKVNVSSLPKGVYFVKTIDKNGVPYQKQMAIER